MLFSPLPFEQKVLIVMDDKCNLDGEDVLPSTEKGGDNHRIYYGKIEGNCSDYNKILSKLHKNKVRNANDNEEKIMIDSIDGAKYMECK